MDFQNTKDELKHILQGKSEVSHGTLIQTIANYLRRSQETSTMAKGSKQFKQQETKELIKFINSHQLWNCNIDFHSFITEDGHCVLYKTRNTLRLA